MRSELSHLNPDERVHTTITLKPRGTYYPSRNQRVVDGPRSCQLIQHSATSDQSKRAMQTHVSIALAEMLLCLVVVVAGIVCLLQRKSRRWKTVDLPSTEPFRIGRLKNF